MPLEKQVALHLEHIRPSLKLGSLSIPRRALLPLVSTTWRALAPGSTPAARHQQERSPGIPPVPGSRTQVEGHCSFWHYPDPRLPQSPAEPYCSSPTSPSPRPLPWRTSSRDQDQPRAVLSACGLAPSPGAPQWGHRGHTCAEESAALAGLTGAGSLPLQNTSPRMPAPRRGTYAARGRARVGRPGAVHLTPALRSLPPTLHQAPFVSKPILQKDPEGGTNARTEPRASDSDKTYNVSGILPRFTNGLRTYLWNLSFSSKPFEFLWSAFLLVRMDLWV